MTTKHLITSLLLILSCTFTAFSQKLPNKQEISVYAPSNVKLDGKITEWGNLQAYNPATEISYTMANDNDILYFICSATELEVMQKILECGITLSINSADKNISTTPPVAVTYPIVPMRYVNIRNELIPNARLDEPTVKLVNDRISGQIKEIKISGFKNLSESSIPVYNEQGIVGTQYVGKDKVYTYELALPLKFISHLINIQGTFNYKLQINGGDPNHVHIIGGTNPGSSYSPSDQPPLSHGVSYLMSPIYFNGSYTLAKK